MYYRNYLIALVFSGTFCSAQNVFELTNVSQNHNISINIENCMERKCNGNAKLYLYDKNSSKNIQTFTSHDFCLILNENLLPDSDSLKKTVILNDFNFDGLEDIAIRNGNTIRENPFFEVYLKEASSKKWVLSDEFTRLVQVNSGMFEVDAERKVITAHSKKDCCVNFMYEYQISPEKDLIKIYQFEENKTDPKKVITKEDKYADNKWFTTTTIYPIELYKKE